MTLADLEESDGDLHILWDGPHHHSSVGVLDARLPTVGLRTQRDKNKTKHEIRIFLLWIQIISSLKEKRNLWGFPSTPARPHHHQLVWLPVSEDKGGEVIHCTREILFDVIFTSWSLLCVSAVFISWNTAPARTTVQQSNQPSIDGTFNQS